MSMPRQDNPFAMCSWHEPRQCQSKPTHYHHIYGQVCGYHAREIEVNHPRPMDKCKMLKGPLKEKLLKEVLP